MARKHQKADLRRNMAVVAELMPFWVWSTRTAVLLLNWHPSRKLCHLAMMHL